MGAGATFSLSAPSPAWPPAPRVWPVWPSAHLCLFLPERPAICWGSHCEVPGGGGGRLTLHLLDRSPCWAPCWGTHRASWAEEVPWGEGPRLLGVLAPPSREVLVDRRVAERGSREALPSAWWVEALVFGGRGGEMVKSGIRGIGGYRVTLPITLSMDTHIGSKCPQPSGNQTRRGQPPGGPASALGAQEAGTQASSVLQFRSWEQDFGLGFSLPPPTPWDTGVGTGIGAGDRATDNRGPQPPPSLWNPARSLRGWAGKG